MARFSPNPVFVLDDAFRVIESNQAAADLIGVPLDQLRGMHSRDFYHPDELPDTETRMRNLRLGQNVRFERWLRCNGHYVRVAASVKRRTIGGYRAEYVPLSGEPVSLPARLHDNGRNTRPLGTLGIK